MECLQLRYKEGSKANSHPVWTLNLKNNMLQARRDPVQSRERLHDVSQTWLPPGTTREVLINPDAQAHPRPCGRQPVGAESGMGGVRSAP